MQRQREGDNEVVLPLFNPELLPDDVWALILNPDDICFDQLSTCMLLYLWKPDLFSFTRTCKTVHRIIRRLRILPSLEKISSLSLKGDVWFDTSYVTGMKQLYLSDVTVHEENSIRDELTYTTFECADLELFCLVSNGLSLHESHIENLEELVVMIPEQTTEDGMLYFVNVESLKKIHLLIGPSDNDNLYDDEDEDEDQDDLRDDYDYVKTPSLSDLDFRNLTSLTSLSLDINGRSARKYYRYNIQDFHFLVNLRYLSIDVTPLSCTQKDQLEAQILNIPFLNVHPNFRLNSSLSSVPHKWEFGDKSLDEDLMSKVRMLQENTINDGMCDSLVRLFSMRALVFEYLPHQISSIVPTICYFKELKDLKKRVSRQLQFDYRKERKHIEQYFEMSKVIAEPKRLTQDAKSLVLLLRDLEELEAQNHRLEHYLRALWLRKNQLLTEKGFESSRIYPEMNLLLKKQHTEQFLMMNKK